MHTCEDVPLQDVIDRAVVRHLKAPEDWYERGGTQEDAEQWTTQRSSGDAADMFFRLETILTPKTFCSIRTGRQCITNIGIFT